jgi:hypothetical protein
MGSKFSDKALLYISPLMRSVANVIPTYTMSLFFLPKSLFHDIDSAIRKFWWGFPQTKKHNGTLLA